MNRDDVIEAMAKAHTSCGCEHYGRPNHEMWGAWPESGREEAREQMRAALSALESLGIAIVPVTPTKEMRSAVAALYSNSRPYLPATEDIWADFLAASPLRPSPLDGETE